MTSHVFTEWYEAHNTRNVFIQPGKPNQNVYIERLNWRFLHLDKLLQAIIYHSVDCPDLVNQYTVTLALTFFLLLELRNFEYYE